ncbi:MAG: hypothetical protein L6R40_000004 [Gallowayella cf. fulva]|nr:MAG: hypothetical protein L6R40_000004 [Xanthomendoza cf. fulva]
MSPTATESSSLERHLSSAEEAQLAEALVLRRRQIDREIAEFTADKEKEFRKFEKRLRSEKRDTERQKILQCERELDKANQKRRGSRGRPAVCPADEANRISDREDEHGRHRSSAVKFSGAVEIPSDNDTSEPRKEREKAKNGATSPDQQPSHEREIEFQGLFTPTYLPLLSGHRQDRGGSDPDTASSRPDDIPATDNPVLSSAPAVADFHSPISGRAPSSPAHPQYLSPSDPRKMSMAERRSSSRSDTSVSSRRSSIRDRKQPRSPKRVLFSIDNVVVSPSTSPTMRRKTHAPRKNGDNDRSVVVPSEPSMPEDRVDANYNSFVKRRDPSGQPSRTALNNIPTTKTVRMNGGKVPFHPAAQMASSSPSMGGDGFEHIRGGDDDDLFGFDEDLTYRDKLERDDDGGDEIREDEIENSVELLPTSSPHAGSLPIEIRWPGRKDPRG